MYFLGIDTTQKTGRLGLVASDNNNSKLITLKSEKISENLVYEIDSFLSSNEVEKKEIVGIGVNIGPGSFTGLRVGVATAIGLAKALGCQCIYISLEECLNQIVKEKEIDDGYLLINFGKKGIILHEIKDSKLLNCVNFMQSDKLEYDIKPYKDVLIYNLVDSSHNLFEKYNSEIIASDNVINKLLHISKIKFIHNKTEKRNIIYI